MATKPLNANRRSPFVIEGDLWFVCQEGGFSWDAWSLEQDETEIKLEDLVAKHFGAERIRYNPDPERAWDANKHVVDRNVGPVRITIERLDE